MLANGDEDWEDQSGDWTSVLVGFVLLAAVIGLCIVLPQWATGLLGVAFVFYLIEFLLRSL